MSMAVYLVTGGAGFIGSAVTRALAARGDVVRVLDDLSTGFAVNLAGLGSQVEFTQGDCCDPSSVTRLATGVAAIIHLGAVPSVPRSVARPLQSNQVNITGTLNVFVAAREAGVPRVVYASSSSVYGRAVQFPLLETLP